MQLVLHTLAELFRKRNATKHGAMTNTVTASVTVFAPRTICVDGDEQHAQPLPTCRDERIMPAAATTARHDPAHQPELPAAITARVGQADRIAHLIANERLRAREEHCDQLALGEDRKIGQGPGFEAGMKTPVKTRPFAGPPPKLSQSRRLM